MLPCYGNNIYISSIFDKQLKMSSLNNLKTYSTCFRIYKLDGETLNGIIKKGSSSDEQKNHSNLHRQLSCSPKTRRKVHTYKDRQCKQCRRSRRPSASRGASKHPSNGRCRHRSVPCIKDRCGLSRCLLTAIYVRRPESKSAGPRGAIAVFSSWYNCWSERVRSISREEGYRFVGPYRSMGSI